MPRLLSSPVTALIIDVDPLLTDLDRHARPEMKVVVAIGCIDRSQGVSSLSAHDLTAGIGQRNTIDLRCICQTLGEVSQPLPKRLRCYNDKTVTRVSTSRSIRSMTCT